MIRMAKRRKPTPAQPPEPPANPWPARLKRIREALGLTQAEAAAKVRVSMRAWSSWEIGQQVPSPSHQLLIDLLENQKI